MIAPEVTNPAILNFLPSSSLDLLTRLVQKWKDWKMSEVDDIVQMQAKKNHAQEWAKKRRTFLEEKHGLTLLTGKRKPSVPEVELREEVPIGRVRLSEMVGAGSAEAEGLKDCSQEASRSGITSRSSGKLT